ncbi:hypothetical protein [Rhodococcus spelaei]|uniref:hypothetical protein n=1 Tax=Rhodococcus spelaei TaxID=2546320 RepID=UPI0015EFCBB2|nr:hypothetical protein [Rhodococcus spelaei]
MNVLDELGAELDRVVAQDWSVSANELEVGIPASHTAECALTRRVGIVIFENVR